MTILSVTVRQPTSSNPDSLATPEVRVISVCLPSSFSARQDPSGLADPLFDFGLFGKLKAHIGQAQSGHKGQIVNLTAHSIDVEPVVAAYADKGLRIAFLIVPKAEQPRVIENSEAFVLYKPGDPPPKMITTAEPLSESSKLRMMALGKAATDAYSAKKIQNDYLFIVSLSHGQDTNGIVVIPSDRLLLAQGPQSIADVLEFQARLNPNLPGFDFSTAKSFLEDQLRRNSTPTTGHALKADLRSTLSTCRNLHELLLELDPGVPALVCFKTKKEVRDFETRLIQAQGLWDRNAPLAFLAVELNALNDLTTALAVSLDHLKNTLRRLDTVDDHLQELTSTTQEQGKPIPEDLKKAKATLLDLRRRLNSPDEEPALVSEDLWHLEMSLGLR